MINYNKNKLINECQHEYYETFSCTLDTADYVPQKYSEKILAYIFKNMKKQFKKIDREDKLYQKSIVKQEKQKTKAKAKVKASRRTKLPKKRNLFSWLRNGVENRGQEAVPRQGES